jgi:hypothetical protein
MSSAEIPFVLWVILGLLGICSLISASLTYRMIHLVNRKLPVENQMRYLFLYPGKLSRLNLFYKQFYPSGRLLFWSRVSTSPRLPGCSLPDSGS